MLWIVQSRLAFGPTPTPTPTARPPFTATPDYLSTRVAEDFLTQQAYQMALLGTQTPTPPLGTPTPPSDASDDDIDELLGDDLLEATNTPVIVLLPGLNVPFTPTPTETFVAPEEFPTATPTANIINLPIVVDSSPLATPTPAQVAEVPVQEPPTPVEQQPTPVETPTETPTPSPTLEQPTPTPTATETLLPPSPTPSPTSTIISPGQPFVVGSLQGFVQERPASLYVGPSTIYERVANQLDPGTRVTILRRNPSGEWLYICCVENRPDQAPVWVRQAFVRPRDNQLQDGAPEGSNPNDVRWLTIEPAPAHLTPLPTLVPPGPDDYPLVHYDRHGSRRVDQLPLPPLTGTWLDAERGTAGLGLVSPVAVAGNSVLVGSADNHLYNFERPTGSQHWRRNLCEDGCRNVTLAPMIYDNEIFLADQNRTVWALGDIANGAGPTTLWRVTLAQPAITSFNVFSETIYLGTGEGGSHTLLALDRDNGAIRWQQPVSGPGLRYPVIGDQLIYAADSSVTAYDLHTGDLVWQNNEVLNVIADPVYGSSGPSSLAELYVFANNNRIYALDANTGVELWNIDNGQSATSLALNQDTLFVAGDNYLKAISRQDRTQRWMSPLVGGQVMGGPLVDATRALVITQAGNLHMFENQSGSAIPAPSIASFVAAAPAVSGAYVFVPGIDGRLYALLGNQ
jgi:outer membrane protein assembly factor BamB